MYVVYNFKTDWESCLILPFKLDLNILDDRGLKEEFLGGSWKMLPPVFLQRGDRDISGLHSIH